MKKLLKTGKKTLSVIMAVMMVLTAWVWVAPTEASAVDSGQYYVEIGFTISGGSYGDEPKLDNNDSGSCVGVIVEFKEDNGTGAVGTKVFDLKDVAKGSPLLTGDYIDGFPTKIYAILDNGGWSTRTLEVTSLKVGLDDASANLKTLWSGKIWLSSYDRYKMFSLSIDGSTAHWDDTSTWGGNDGSGTGNSDNAKIDETTTGWSAPKASTVEFASADTTNRVLTQDWTNEFKYKVLDQYGVVMSTTALTNLKTKPTTTITCSNYSSAGTSATVGTTGNLYYTTTDATDAYKTVITAKEAFKSDVIGVNEREVKIEVGAGNATKASKTYKITDPKYTVTFNKNADEAETMAPATYSVYYGETLASQAAIDGASTYPTGGNRPGHTFIGMFDAAEGGNLMNINEQVLANKTYYAHWEKLNYAAIFMDRTGESVIHIENPIPYGDASQEAQDAAAKLPEIEYDNNNHYVLDMDNVWTPSTDKVTDNTFFYPNYTTVAHTFGEGEYVEATCQHGAGYVYSCTGCDYYYVEETSSTTISHTKSENYVVDKEATCTTEGKGHYYCVDCGTELDSVTIEATHSYQSEITKAATCQETGLKVYTCSKCDFVAEETIPLLPHSYEEGTTVAATCASSAYTPYTCDCGDTYNKYEGNATTEHNWSITVSDVTANNTKVVTGTCSVCSATFTKEVELPATHNFTKVEITKQPTCKTEGEIKISCADEGCNESYTAELPTVATAHDEYVTTYTAATCGVKGSVVTKCKTCDVTIEETEIAALEHSYSYVRVEPTCTTAGSITKTCANCKDVVTETIPEAGHKTVTVEANCQHGGYEKCGVCDTVISETAKKEHTYTGAVTEVAATCTVDGIRFTKCKDCDAQKAEILDRTGHKVPDKFTVVVPATCETKGYQVKICSECNVVLESEEIAPLNHNYVKDEDESYAPTCTTAGATVVKCSRCGDINTTVLQPLGHKYANTGAIEDIAATCTTPAYKNYKCDVCGDTKTVYVVGSTTLPHDFTGAESNIVNATCIADGSKTVQCKKCEQTINVVIPKLGHAYPDTWTVAKEATNSEDGKWTRTCTNCTNVEEITIPKGNHNLELDEDESYSATCSKKGLEVYKCTNHETCSVTVSVVLDESQHTIAQKTTDATCTEKGKVEAYCSVCDAECAKPFSTTETPVVPHTYEEKSKNDATCTTSGYTVMACACGTATYNRYDADTPALGHDFTGDETIVDSTCTVNGSKTVQCSNCTETYTTTLPLANHKYVADGAAVPATCTAPATQNYKCDYCNIGYTEYVSAANGHKWSENWTLVREATDNEYGVEKTTCTVAGCDAEQFRTIAPIGDHEFTATVTKDATCTAEGEKKFTCSKHADCKANYTEKIPATGHTQKIDYTAPTCVAEGASKVVCSTQGCNVEILSQSIPAITYHNFSGNGVVTTDATCEGTGTMTYTCLTDGCNATKTEVIPAKGHNLSTTVTDAKCGEKGSVVTTCSRCDYTQTTELAAKGHIWKETPESTVAAKCETDGSETYMCQNCDATNVVVLPKLGHSWSAWTKTDATSTTDGKWTRTCSTCNILETLTIPRGHNLVRDEKNSTAASCTEEGKEIYICDAHTGDEACDVKIEVKLSKLQHNYTTEYVNATCSAKGHIKTTCTGCNDVIVDKEIGQLAHKMKEFETHKATCSTAEYIVYKCEVCRYSYPVYAITAKPVEHDLIEGDSTATCTAEGTKSLSCKNCNYSVSVNVPKEPHNYEKQGETVDATCTTPSTEVYRCSGCGDEYTKLVEAEKGHSFGNWSVTQDATTDKFGIQERSCSVCGYVEYDKIAPIGNHVFKEEVVKPVSCTEDGEISYTCTVATHGTCSANYTKTIPATGHTEAFAYEAATCSKDGFAKMYCSTCTTVLSEQSIPALGHAYGDGVVTPSTCKTEGKIVYTCTREGCNTTHEAVLATNENAHQYETVVTNATCYKEGSVVTKCKLCQNKLSEETLIKTEHTWDDGTETTPATCTTKGEKTYKCTVEGCTATKTEPIDALGHDWGNWFVEKALTNTDKGEMKRTCNRQNCNAYETHEIPAGGHEWDEGEVTKEATCTSTGTKVYSCKNHTGDNACGITFTVTLDKLQHTLTTSKTDATCTKNGEVVTKCKNCNTTTITTIIPATGHIYDGGNKTPATCTDEGKIVYTCIYSGCNDTKEVILDKLPHAFNLINTVDATCTMSGYNTYKCDNCNETYNEINGNAKGHDLEEIVTSGSCTKAGEVVLSCKTEDCDYSVKVSVPALGHDYKKISSTDATCAAAATETYKCSRCEASYTVSVGDKLTDDSAHDWSTWTVVVEATEASIGYKTRECRICHKLKIDTIDATGEHKFEDGKVVEGSRVDPTCTDNGHETRKCSVHEDCGETAVVTIPATGHAEEKIVAVAATCTTEGSSEGSKCTKCGTVLVAPVTLPKLGHNWAKGEIKDATCIAEGSITYNCDNCGDTATVEIPVSDNAHNYTTQTTPVSCTTDGTVVTTCSLCGDSTTVKIPAKGHDFSGTETLVKAATCTADGLKTVKCANCNETTEVVISKLGHNMVKGDKVDATCTTSGYTPYICDNKDCDHSYRVYDEAVVEHNYVQVEGSSTATCLAGGTVTMQCSVCKDEITAAVPALGHSYGDWSTINPTASAEGSKTRECSICKTKETVILPALGHEMVKDEAASTKASCTAEGTDVYVCTTHTGDSACGYTYSVKVPVIAHNYDESIDTKVTTVAPTCTENGSKTVECKDCNATVTTVIPRTGHTMSTTVTEATCEAEGSVVTKCTADGCTYKLEDKVLAKKPHTISIAYAYPGCTIEGYVKEACDKCDYEKILSTTPALGHSYTEDVEVTKPAGCLEPGKKTVKCSRCTATTEVDIPATGHDYQPGEEVEATCTTSGYVPYSCQNEGCSSSYNNLTSNPNGHTWKTEPEAESTAATCVADGKTVYKCQFCDTKNEVVVHSFGHSWTPWTVSKAPTANSTGESTRTCLREGCSMVETLTIPALGESVSFTVSFVVEGKLISTQKVSYGSAATAPEVAVKAPDADYHYSFSWDTDFAEVTADLTVNGIYTATGHTYGEWITDRPADCNNSGLRHRECTCGYVDQEVISKLAHSLSVTVQEEPATCTENGYRVVACVNCGAEETQTLKRLGHSMTYYSGYAATCDSEGVANHYNCSRCGKDFEDKNGIIEITSVILVKKYHTFVVVDGSTATCTSDGVTDYKFCTMCGYVQHSETIPAYGHTDADGNDRCDRCGILYENNGALVCSCNCHKKGTINELFYKILLFFWKLFGINKSCDCGTVHY